ncbi:hypothetical protein [Kitasatospora purpeofusca]|nr:hypothetical protein [Kitasatospora purpeofusca]MDY0816244.1 hypothetical protein [Kitasatospora purpeofusca]
MSSTLRGGVPGAGGAGTGVSTNRWKPSQVEQPYAQSSSCPPS